MEKTLKLLLPLTVTLLLCINPAAGLTCHTCEKKDCLDSDPPELCTAGRDACVTITYNDTSNGKSTIKYARRCQSADHCPEDETAIMSLTTKQSTVLARVKCCKTDKCNHDSLPVPTAPPGGTAECPVCETDRGPCGPLKCGALDTKCFDYDDTFRSSFISGCASSSTCGYSDMMDNLYTHSTGKMATGLLLCQDPPNWCKMCLDPEEPCAEPAHPDMRCMSATVEEPNTVTIDLKGMAGPPLCSSDGSNSHHHAGKRINVTCCSSNHCNIFAPPKLQVISPLQYAGEEVEFNNPPQSCPGNCPLTPDLIEQLQKIVEGKNFIPPHDAPSGQPGQPGQPGPPDHGDNGNDHVN